MPTKKRPSKSPLGEAKLTSDPVTFHFTAGYNKVIEEEGWRPKEIPGFDPVSGVMCIHDMVEHFPGREAGAPNEYLAQGAMLFVRYLGGYFGDVNDLTGFAESVVPPAFGMLFGHILDKKLPTQAHPKDALHTEPLDGVAEFAISALITEAWGYITDGDNDVPKTRRPELLKSLLQAPGYMRAGFRLAQKRYPHLKDAGRRRDLCTAWHDAARRLDQHLRSGVPHEIRQAKKPHKDADKHTIVVTVDTKLPLIRLSVEEAFGRTEKRTEKTPHKPSGLPPGALRFAKVDGARAAVFPAGVHVKVPSEATFGKWDNGNTYTLASLAVGDALRSGTATAFHKTRIYWPVK